MKISITNDQVLSIYSLLKSDLPKYTQTLVNPHFNTRFSFFNSYILDILDPIVRALSTSLEPKSNLDKEYDSYLKEKSDAILPFCEKDETGKLKTTRNGDGYIINRSKENEIKPILDKIASLTLLDCDILTILENLYKALSSFYKSYTISNLKIGILLAPAFAYYMI
jgi:hypothetical protein